MARNCGCSGSSCGCIIEAGAGITITGIGTVDDPYRVVADLGDIGSALSFQDTSSVDFTVTGSGTVVDPLVVSAVTIPQPFPAYTTAGRPSAVAAGLGAYYYDTTTEVPMWSDGSVWQAAASGGGSPTWGAITGTLSSQTDLQTALNAKITAFADPNADRIVFWDDSAGAFAALTASTGLTISGTDITVRSSSTSQTGMIETATTAETVTGASGTLAATPAGVLATRGLYVGINAQTGTTYAPVLADQGQLVTITNAGAITVTLPSNATTAFPIGTQIDFAAMGAGAITFVPGSGATAVGTPSLITRAQYSAVTVIKTGTNSWLAVGDLV